MHKKANLQKQIDILQEQTPNKLTFLGIKIKNHPLFEQEVDFFVTNEQRVYQDNSNNQLANLYGSLWVNKMIALVGRNATGKTTILKTVIGALSLLLQDKSISQTRLKDILIGINPISLEIYFYGSDKTIFKDEIIFKRNMDSDWYIESEKIYSKYATKRFSKKKLFEFDKNKDLIYDRNTIGDVALNILAEDDSIFRIVRKKRKYLVQTIVDALIFTNDVNVPIYNNKDVPTEILEYLDPTIEYLKIDNKQIDSHKNQAFYRLKFKGTDNEITDTNFATIERYLSSGTAKGVTLYGNIIATLKNGGIIFIDELENHFNHTIVRTFIEYFSNKRINRHNSTLIFTTHYSELLDDFERGDEIYIAKRDEKIHLQRYSSTKVRTELNKAEVFDSDYLGGTVPEYNSYLKLRKATEKVVSDGG
ncbi:AAA family ATPase [Ligilactobacillus equi]|uniref:AAA+ ATPase domain-containing protein n=1 Tax=Ligilactobacillus equi DPC 6820 TaxID=1392007 RepID=V7I0Q3_9LACO|nr:ATP-binding protein [Ligilactobacillus equi]ETA75028.1 hypothetical protein LEQ_1443c [Ligilactobacillus equi DPC 6820]